MALTKEDIKDLAKVFSAAMEPKEKKKAKKKAKFVMIVDGKVQSALIPSKKEAENAARIITMKQIATKGTAPKIAIAAINEVLTIDLPVSATEVNGIKGN